MVIDTSALCAIILGEPDAEAMLAAMIAADALLVSAATLVEATVVVEARQGREAGVDLHALLAEIDATIVPFDEDQSLAAAGAWRRFGRGRHPAALNLGDTFAYALATSRGEALLFKGDDFSQTDVLAAQ